MKETPLSRKEMYLSNIAGEDTPIPVPMNREERYYKKIIEGLKKACKSGLPEIKQTITEVLAQTSVEFEREYGLYYGNSPGVFDISAGDVLTVYWDGEAYECPAVAAPDIAEGAVSFGDSDNTGEFPFGGLYDPTQQNIGWTTPNAGPHTISISNIEQSPADGYILGVDNGEWKAIPNEGGSGGGALYVEQIYDEAIDRSYLADTNGDPVSYAIVKAAIDSGRSCILRTRTEFPELGTVSYNLVPCVRCIESPNYSDYYAVIFRDPQDNYYHSFEASSEDGALIYQSGDN